MDELTSLEMLTNIKGATSSEAIEQLFDTLRNATTEKGKDDEINLLARNAISTEELREDVAVETSAVEKELIIANFPKQKDNYLVVPKVIEE